MKRPRLCGDRLMFGVYPHGMRDVAVYEVSDCCKATVKEEYLELDALTFGYAEGCQPVGCFYNIFIYIGIDHIKDGSIEEVKHALMRLKVKEAFRDDLLQKYKSWRVRGYRYAKDGMEHNFNTMDLEKVTADCIDSDKPVDLSDNVEVEVVVWLYDNTIVVGWRPKEAWERIDAGKAMSINKGNRNSRAPDAVSFCIAHLALMNHKVVEEDMIVVDPMCGVGSYLFAMYFILAVRSSNKSIKLYGYDQDEEAIAIARSNATRLGWDIAFQVRDCAEAVGPKGADGLSGGDLPIKADLVLVDPPWGHRHLTHSMVRKLYPRWSRSWLSLLKNDNSLCVVVTIRTSHIEKEILPHLRYRVSGFREVARVRFDNMGFGQCTAYLWAVDSYNKPR